MSKCPAWHLRFGPPGSVQPWCTEEVGQTLAGNAEGLFHRAGPQGLLTISSTCWGLSDLVLSPQVSGGVGREAALPNI